MSKVITTVLERGLTEVKSVSDEEIAHLEEKRSKMYGVEADAMEALATRIETLRASSKFAGLSKIDKRVFTWRWPNKARDWSSTPGIRSCALPRVGLLRLDNPGIRLHSPGGRNVMRVESFDSKRFPKAWSDSLDDVRKDLSSIAGRFGDSYLRFRWDGVIPNEARAKIAEAVQLFGAEDTFLLVETPAKAWKLDAPSIAERIDPLIVGHSGGMFFYVGQFDPTGLEEYIADEFVG